MYQSYIKLPDKISRIPVTSVMGGMRTPAFTPPLTI